MSDELTRLIAEANALLPGTPVDDGLDRRWQAIIAVGEFIEAEPTPIWDFIVRWGGHHDEDLRDAIATCLLEHLLEHHFSDYFPSVENRAMSDAYFADMFLRCWAFGQAKDPDNALRFQALADRLTKRLRL